MKRTGISIVLLALAVMAAAGAWWRHQSQTALRAACNASVERAAGARAVGEFATAQKAIDEADARCAAGQPGNAFRLERAEILLARAEVPAAAKAFEVESKAQPTNARVWGQLGFALALLERRDEATLALEEALRQGDASSATAQRLAQLRQATRTAPDAGL
jgi:predicted Zn-dependent protease